jgi:multiple sugar transport system permease protein
MGVAEKGVLAVAIRRIRVFRSMRQREAFEFYLGISPWLIGFLAFTGGPILASFVISFTDWNLLSSPHWAGIANYVKLITGDEAARIAFYNTAYYTALSVPLAIISSFFTALLLNQKVPGTNIFRTLFYLPTVTSGVAMALLWVWLLNPEFGLLNLMLKLFGIQGPAWLFDPAWAKPALIITSLWGIGSTTVIFLAGLQGMPQHLYDAAKIDGASQLQEFRNVTLPMMTPSIFFVLITSIIGSLQNFTNVYVMTQGGPGWSTLMYGLYLYQNAFEYLKMGYASSLAWILFLVILVLTIAQLLGARRWVYYEGEIRGRV